LASSSIGWDLPGGMLMAPMVRPSLDGCIVHQRRPDHAPAVA
jgi:hypothetical protein